MPCSPSSPCSPTSYIELPLLQTSFKAEASVITTICGEGYIQASSTIVKPSSKQNIDLGFSLQGLDQNRKVNNISSEKGCSNENLDFVPKPDTLKCLIQSSSEIDLTSTDLDSFKDLRMFNELSEAGSVHVKAAQEYKGCMEAAQGFEGYVEVALGAKGYAKAAQGSNCYVEAAQGSTGYVEAAQGTKGYNEAVHGFKGYLKAAQGSTGYVEAAYLSKGYLKATQGYVRVTEGMKKDLETFEDTAKASRCSADAPQEDPCCLEAPNNAPEFAVGSVSTGYVAPECSGGLISTGYVPPERSTEIVTSGYASPTFVENQVKL